MINMGLYTEQITNYLQTHSGATEDDIARDLEINIVDVLDTLETLKKRGAIKSYSA